MAYVDHNIVDGVQYDIRDAEAVSFEQEQTLTDAQQEQARANIGAGSEADVADLKSQMSKVYDGDAVITTGINKLNPSEIAVGYLLETNGHVSEDARYTVSGYIPVNTDHPSIAFTGLNANGTARACLPLMRIVFFDGNKTAISNVNNIASNTITPIPTDAIYARLNWINSYNARSLMVELVDNISDMSVVFVEYGESMRGYRGIYGLNTSIENIYGNPSNISELFGFTQGGIQSNGNFRPDWKYRVATPDIHDITRDFSITIDNAYRVFVALYASDDTFISASWITGYYVIRAGSRIRLAIAKKTEDTSIQADVATFCSNVSYVFLESLFNISNKASGNINYGVTWDWWITANSIDQFGNAYIGYVDTEEYAGLLRRQPDGTMQYKQLEKSFNDDDHNGMATIVLDDGRILVIGAQSHAQNNKMICYRSKQPYSIDEMERFSFDVPQGSDYIYRITYSQVFKYNGRLFDFCRCGSYGDATTLGYACLISDDDGATWTAYKAITASDPYASFCLSSDDPKIIKGVIGKNPGTRPVDMFKGFTFDMSTNQFSDLSENVIGQLVPLNTGSMDDTGTAHYSDMTDLVPQGETTRSCRLFYVGNSPKAETHFLYAIADDSTNADWVYKLYKNGTIIDVGRSGVPFGNNTYISGVCFGKDVDTIYYAKATTTIADGAHELHKVRVSNNAVISDETVIEASICILRPLFLSNGELATVVGHYNDQNSDGTFNGSFVAWELKPMFTRA